MDLLETMPWGQEEAEQEREFLSEAWLSTPMLEEDNDHSTEQDNDLDKSNESPHEHGPIKKKDVEMSLGNNEAFLKWMEMNDMELAMYQQSSVRQDFLKNYADACDWESSNSSVADTTQALLEEFETVCEEYHGALTPPQSRTPSPPPPLIPYFPQTIAQPPAPTCQAPQSPPTIDLAQELALLDELVRDRAEALENAKPHLAPKCNTMTQEPTNIIEILVNCIPDVPLQVQIPAPVLNEKTFQGIIIPDTIPIAIPSVKVELVSPSPSPTSLQEVPSSSEGLPSPSSYISPNSVTPSSPGSPRPNTPASSTCGDGEEASDPEWVPMKTTPRRQRSKPYTRTSPTSGYSSSERSEMSPGPSTSRGRRVPRNRGQAGPEDRKERKKEQNKNAATRYRQKKRAEAEEVASEEKDLENKNDELRAKAADLAREVSYLKKLMKEMFKAKGML